MDPTLKQLADQMIVECERLTMENIELYDVQGYSPLTDVVLIATATHVLQLEAARRSLSFMAKEAGFPIQNPTEDYSEGWLAMDFVDLVVHILVENKRAFYDLDGLMESIKNTRSQNDSDLDGEETDELTEAELEEIIDQLNPEEREDFLNILEERSQD